jgi:Ca-activated chloride channel family protein
LTKDDGSGVTEAVVATVDVRFREPGTDEVVTDRVEVKFPMAPWVTPKRGFFDSPDLPIVQKSFVMLNIFVAFEMAAVSYYSGEPDAAHDVLERVIAGVEDYNDEVGDTDIDYDLVMLRDLRDLIAAEIAPPPAEIPDDPWPAD